MPVQTPPPPPTADHQYRPSSTKTGSLTTTTTTHPPPPESEHLPCPRCDSTNTKFCYYNNYNFSQPRHFCKSCRRYWTHGGTLRDIPVGGGTRKNAKRPRNSSSSTSNTNATTPTPTSSSSSSAGCVGGSSRSGHPHSKTTLSSSTTGAVTSTVSRGLSLTTGSLIDPVFVSMSSSLPAPGVYVEDYLKPSSSQGQSGVGGNVFPVGSMGSGGSFTSLLNASGGGGFLALGGFGVGPSFEDVGFGRGMWATVPEVSYLDNGANTTASGYGVAGNGGGNFWQMESGGEHHHNNHTNGGSAGVGFVSGDCFSWPELAISTPRNGLK